MLLSTKQQALCQIWTIWFCNALSENHLAEVKYSVRSRIGAYECPFDLLLDMQLSTKIDKLLVDIAGSSGYNEFVGEDVYVISTFHVLVHGGTI